MTDQTVVVEPVADDIPAPYTKREWAGIFGGTVVRLVPFILMVVVLNVVLGWEVLVAASVLGTAAGAAIWRGWQPAWATAVVALAAGFVVHILAAMVTNLGGWTLSPWFALLVAPGSAIWWMAVSGIPMPWESDSAPEVQPEPVQVQPRRSYDKLSIGAQTETGQPWVLPFDIGMVLLVGASGSGKSSALWSILAELAPGIPEKMVRFCGVDPKTLELGRACELFDWWVSSTDHLGLSGLPADLEPEKLWLQRVAWALEREVDLMNERTRSMYRAREEKFTPSPGHPITVIVIDELLRITATVADSALKAQINSALVELLSNGRAVGWRVIAATQLIDASVLGSLRKLFPLRICLRVATQFDVDMALGKEARALYGADAHLIPTTEEGAGYVLDAESCTATRVRSRFVPKSEVLGLVREYGTPHAVQAEPPTLELPAVAHIADRVAAVWPGQEKAMHIDELADLLGESPDEVAGQLRDAGCPVEPRVSRMLPDGSKTGKRGVRWTSFVGWRAAL